MTTTEQRVAEYLRQNGPTEPWRIALDLRVPVDDVVAMAIRWEPRERIAGPGGNYVAAVRV